MQKIDISITKAQIKSYDVSFSQEGEPKVSVSVGLYTANGKEISTFSISNSSWADNKFDLEPAMLAPIYGVAKHLEAIAIRQCSAAIGILPQKATTPDIKIKEEKYDFSVDINADDLPF